MADPNGSQNGQPIGPVLLSISALLCGVGVLGLANGMMFTLVGVRMSMDGVSAQMIGLVGAGYFAGLLAGTAICGKVIRRVGHIRAFTVFAAIAAIAAILHALILPVPVWVVLRAAMGFSSAGLFMVAESWLQAVATNETRGRTFAFYAIVSSAGAGAGPLLLNLGDPATFQLFAVASILFSVALLPVALSTVGNPELGESRRFGVRELYAISPVAVTGAVAAGMIGGAMASLAPVFAEQIGLAALTISLFVTAMRLGGFLMQYPIGSLSDRFDRRQVMIGLHIAIVAVCTLAVLIGSPLPVAVLALGLVFGGLNQPLYGLVVAHAYDYIERQDFVAASAGLLFAYGVGAIAGPLTAAPAMGWLGPWGLFMYTAAVAVAFTAFIVYRTRRRAPVPKDKQSGFRVVVKNSPTATLLDPRAPWERRRDPERLKVERMLDEARWR